MRAGRGERLNQVASLVAQGIKDAKGIATKLGISVPYASVCLSKVRKQEQERLKAQPATLDVIDAQEKALQAQLQKLAADKQRLLDLKALKILPCWDGAGVLIKKENERMALRLDDARELVEKLTDFLASDRDKQ